MQQLKGRLLAGTIGRTADSSNHLTLQTKGPGLGPSSFMLRSVSVKQLFEERFLPLGVTVLIAAPVRLGVTSVMALIILRS
jgi:hypothetical protein